MEHVDQTTDDGQTNRMTDRPFEFSEFSEYSQIPKNHEKRCMSHRMHLFVPRVVPRILDTTKTYLQGAYGQYALHTQTYQRRAYGQYAYRYTPVESIPQEWFIM